MKIEWKQIYSHIQNIEGNSSSILIFVIFIIILIVIGFFASIWLFRSELAQIKNLKSNFLKKPLFIIQSLLFLLTMFLFGYIGFHFFKNTINEIQKTPIVIYANFDSIKIFQNIINLENDTSYRIDYEVYLSNMEFYYLTSDGQLNTFKKETSFSFPIHKKQIISHLKKNLQKGKQFYFLFDSEESFIGYIHKNKVYFFKK